MRITDLHDECQPTDDFAMQTRSHTDSMRINHTSANTTTTAVQQATCQLLLCWWGLLLLLPLLRCCASDQVLLQLPQVLVGATFHLHRHLVQHLLQVGDRLVKLFLQATTLDGSAGPRCISKAEQLGQPPGRAAPLPTATLTHLGVLGLLEACPCIGSGIRSGLAQNLLLEGHFTKRPPAGHMQAKSLLPA